MNLARFSLGLLLLTSTSATASPDVASSPAPFPVFLRLGFSSVLEFEEAPVRVVLGDSQTFQVERLGQSLVLRAMAAYAASNMFVYFPEKAPKLFILSAAEDANPTYYRKIEEPKVPFIAKPSSTYPSQDARKAISRIVSTQFDAKKDYLTVEAVFVADSAAILRPNWELSRLRFKSRFQAPFRLWSERKVVQKDSSIRARFVFAKPNVPRDLSSTFLILPIEGKLTPISLSLKGVAR